MSREVDERIVEMQFDNQQFERGVAQTITSLDKLTEALKFENVGDSVRGIQNGINNLNFTPITNGVTALEGTLTSLGGRIKLEVFDRLANYAVDTGEKIINALTLKGARAGFAEYETQQGAVQTILANTQHLGTTVADVNKALNDLNEYADLTIYNFTEMTRNIGTFTAAGLDLETSTSAIKGIANLAAVSGSTSEQASRAMYQLSQALAAGRVNLQDWNSVVNAGMGGKVFQDALKRTAKHMGIVVDETKSFRESISAKDGSAWLTADVLSETLKQFSGDLDEAALAAQGWSEAEIKSITDMAKTATDAATVVKTFSQLMDTVTEQVGSGWTRTWQLIFGDFEESKELWTGVYKAISPYIDAISDLRNGYLQFWKENEGREKVIQAFSNLWSGASNFIDKFTDAFKDAFPIFDNFGQVLVDISDRFLSFSERFKVVKDKADQLSGSFTKVSDAIGKITAEDKKNALDIWNWGNINGRSGRIDGQARVEALGGSYDRVQKYIDTFIASGYDVAKTDELLGVGASDVSEALDATATSAVNAISSEDKLAITLHNLTHAFASVVDVAKTIGGSILNIIKAAGSAFGDVFDSMTVSRDIAGVAGVLSKVAHAFEITAEKAEDVKRIFRGVFAAFDIVYRLIRAVATAIGSALLPSLGGVDKASGGLLKVLGNFGDWVYALDQAIREGDLFSVAIEKMIGFISTLDDKVIGVIHSFEKWSGIDFGKIASKITGAISKGLDILKDWTGIDIKSIFSSLWEHIKTFLGLLKEGDFKGAFKYVVDGIKNFASTIADAVKSFSLKDTLEKAGGIFGSIGEWFKKIFDKDSLSEAASTSGNVILNIFGGIAYALKTAFDFIWSIVTGPAAQHLGENIKELFANLFKGTEEGAEDERTGMEKLKDFLVGIGSALSAFYEEIKPIISAGFSGAFLKTLMDIAAAAKNFSEAPKNFASALLEFATGFDNMQKSLKIETMSRFVNALANGIIKLVIAIAAIMVLDKMEGGVYGAMTVITFMFAELIGILTYAQKKLDNEINMVFLIRMIKALGNVIMKLSLSLAMLALLDPVRMGSALVGFNTIMIDLGIMLGVMSKIISSKQFRRGGEGLVMLVAVMDQLGKTVMKMTFAVAILSMINPEKMTSALYGLMGIFAALALSLATVTALAKHLGDDKKDEIAAIGGVLMTIAGAFLMMVPAVALLAAIPEDNLNSALAVTVGIGALLAGMMVALEVFSKGNTNSKAIAAAGAAMAGVAFAIQMIVPALALLAILDSDEMWGSVAAISAIMAAMMLLLYVLSNMGGGNVALAGVGIMAVAFAIDLVVPAIIAFGKFAIPILEKAFAVLKKQSGGTIAKIIAAVLGFSVVLTIASVAVAALGVALIPLGIALALILLPISSLIKSIAMLAPLVAVVAAAGSEIGKVLAETITKFLKTLAEGAGEIAEAVTEAAPLIAEAVLAVLDAILYATLGRIPIIAEAFLSTIDATLDAFIAHSGFILSKLGTIIDIILNWLDQNVSYWAEKITIILLKIIGGVILGLAEHIGEILYALGVLIGAIVNGIWMLFVGFFDGLFGKNENGQGKWSAFWEDVGGNAIDSFFDAWLTGARSIKHFFTVTLPKKIKDLWEDIKAVGKKIGDAILEGVESVLPKSWNEWWEEKGGEGIDVSAPEIEVHDIDYYRNLKKSEKKAVAANKKAGAAAGNAYVEGYRGKDGIDAHSAAVTGIDASKDYADGVIVGTQQNMPSIFGIASEAGDGYQSSFLNQIEGSDMGGSLMDIVNGQLTNADTSEYTKNINDMFKTDVTPTVNIKDWKLENSSGQTFMEKFNKMTKKDDLTGSGSWMDNFNMTYNMSQESVALENQRHADTEANSAKVQKLTDAISALTDKWKGGIINIPENATFTVPVTVDGQAMAEVTAPYLDVINAKNTELSTKGVAY